MFKACGYTLLLTALCLWPPSSAQTREDGSIDVFINGSAAKSMTLTPVAAKIVFPSARVFLEKKDVRANLPVVDSALLQDVQFVTVRNYPKEEAAPNNLANKYHLKGGTPITAVVYKNEIYIVSELFCSENTETINKLMRLLNVRVDSSEKAMQIANFYLQLSYYHFNDPEEYVVSTFLQLPSKEVEFPGQNKTEIQNAIHPPVVTKDGNTYKVDVVTREMDSAFVLLHHWAISIHDSQISRSQEEVVIPQRLHYRNGEAPSDRMGGTFASPLSSLKFQLNIMADGKTPDSERLNVSTYGFNTSDGPQVLRTAYFFSSPERATRELRHRLRQASQIIEQGNWIDGEGKVLGERALVLYSAERGSGQYAAVLLRRDSRFFELSSSCLRNVLDFEKVWFHSESNAK